jgi:hypothetical protein
MHVARFLVLPIVLVSLRDYLRVRPFAVRELALPPEVATPCCREVVALTDLPWRIAARPRDAMPLPVLFAQLPPIRLPVLDLSFLLLVEWELRP